MDQVELEAEAVIDGLGARFCPKCTWPTSLGSAVIRVKLSLMATEIDDAPTVLIGNRPLTGRRREVYRCIVCSYEEYGDRY